MDLSLKVDQYEEADEVHEWSVLMRDVIADWKLLRKEQAAIRLERQQIEQEREVFNAKINNLRRNIEGTQKALAEAMAEVDRLTLCDCGRKLGPGLCGICDNDE